MDASALVNLDWWAQNEALTKFFVSLTQRVQSVADHLAALSAWRAAREGAPPPGVRRVAVNAALYSALCQLPRGGAPTRTLAAQLRGCGSAEQLLAVAPNVRTLRAVAQALVETDDGGRLGPARRKRRHTRAALDTGAKPEHLGGVPPAAAEVAQPAVADGGRRAPVRPRVRKARRQ
jgi:hypothetical protein